MRGCCLTGLTLLIATGCSSTYDVGDSSRVNINVPDRTVAITTWEGSEITGTGLSVRDDSTALLESPAGKRITIATSSVKSIAVNSTGGGAIDGLIVGGIVGAPLGVMLSAYSTSMEGSGMDIGALVGPIVGAAAVGAGVGAIMGRTDTYNFDLFAPGADSPRLSPYDTVVVTVDEILDESVTSFVGRIDDRTYSFDKVEATYAVKKSATGVTTTVRGTRNMFKRVRAAALQ